MELVKNSKVTGRVIVVNWNTWKLELRMKLDRSWRNQYWRRVDNFLLSKEKTLSVLTFNEDGYPTIALKKVEQDDNQEWEVIPAPEAPATQSIATGTT